VAPPRRAIEEWVALFEVIPEIKHIFVEGETDRRILKAHLRGLQRGNVDVRLVDEADIPASNHPPSPFCSGNRARLIIFASAVSERIKPGTDNVRFLIDQDCDLVLPIARTSSLIRVTDFANFLICFAQFDAIRYVVESVYGKALPQEQYEKVIKAAQFLFALRILRYSMHPEAEHIDPEPSFTLVHDKLQFDREDFLRRFLLANGLFGSFNLYSSETEKLLNRFRGDPRQYMQFDDFMTLFYRALKLLRFLPPGTTRLALESVYRASITKERILEIPVFRDLAAWSDGEV
jgi:hypothetical protein